MTTDMQKNTDSYKNTSSVSALKSVAGEKWPHGILFHNIECSTSTIHGAYNIRSTVFNILTNVLNCYHNKSSTEFSPID